MKTYSVDLRERVCWARDTGVPRAEVASRFRVSESSVSRWHRMHRAGRALVPRPKPGRPPKIAPGDRPALVAQVRARPDATLAQHCDAWAADRGVRVSDATMSRLLGRLGLPLKKRP